MLTNSVPPPWFQVCCMETYLPFHFPLILVILPCTAVSQFYLSQKQWPKLYNRQLQQNLCNVFPDVSQNTSLFHFPFRSRIALFTATSITKFLSSALTPKWGSSKPTAGLSVPKYVISHFIHVTFAYLDTVITTFIHLPYFATEVRISILKMEAKYQARKKK